MRRIFAVIFIFVSAAALPQGRVTGVAPSKPSGVIPRWDKGVVEGRTYRNVSVGLELTAAPGLEFGTPELKGNPGSVPLLVTISALGEERLFSGREVMAFYTDALAYYPETRRSTEAYMQRVILGNRKEGFEPEEVNSETLLSGIAFERRDFNKGSRHEGVLVKACEAQALVFIFAGSDRDAVDKLIGATNLKLDFGHSGCSPNAH
jgi:hypothetical protein